MMYPEPHFVYRIYGPDGQLLYIGSTKDPERRKALHVSNAGAQLSSTMIAQAGGIARFEVEEHPDKLAALDAERTAIRAEAPPFNRMSNPKRWRRAPGGYVPVEAVAA